MFPCLEKTGQNKLALFLIIVHSMLDNHHTIVASATPLAASALAVIRLSGVDAKALVEACLHKKLHRPNRVYYREFYAKSKKLDNLCCTWFQAPNSFTGEEVVELTSHGSLPIIQTILESLLKKGARLARPGEFSERAFINNKIDLAQAESIMDIIHADSLFQVQASLRSLDGKLSAEVQALKAQLLEILIHAETSLDFSDQDIDYAELGDLKEKSQKLFEFSTNLCQAIQDGVRINQGLKVVLLGKPNVGKSSIFNLLCGQDKAIVTNIAGTTRDSLSSRLERAGASFELIDTAGIRETSEEIEKQGIEKSLKASQQAQLVLCVVDVSQKPAPVATAQWLKEEIVYFGEMGVDFSRSQSACIVNKIDCLQDAQNLDCLNLDSSFPNTRFFWTSVKDAKSFDEVFKYLGNFWSHNFSQESYTASERVKQHIEKAQAHIQKMLSMLEQNDYLELAAEESRLAMQELEKILGKLDVEELLDEIFSRFCIGK